MKTVQDFFDRYKIDEFYKWQQTTTKNPVLPFIKSKHEKLSHGIIPGFRNYDLFYERYLSAVQLLKDKELVFDGMKILDIGSGEGFFKFFFDVDYKAKLDWRGVEVWKERAEFCRHIGYEIDELNLEEGSLPYADGAFDMVLASHVIEHIPNPSQIVQELGRVLKKGGILLVVTPTKFPIIAELDSLYHKLSNRKTGDTQQAFTHKSLEKLVLKSLDIGKDSIIDKRTSGITRNWISRELSESCTRSICECSDII